jgi:hypothetical protein
MQRALCPRLEPDLATRSSRSYSGLHMTSFLSQGLSCQASFGVGKQQPGASHFLGLRTSVLRVVSPAPCQTSPSCSSPL